MPLSESSTSLASSSSCSARDFFEGALYLPVVDVFFATGGERLTAGGALFAAGCIPVGGRVRCFAVSLVRNEPVLFIRKDPVAAVSTTSIVTVGTEGRGLRALLISTTFGCVFGSGTAGFFGSVASLNRACSAKLMR